MLRGESSRDLQLGSMLVSERVSEGLKGEQWCCLLMPHVGCWVDHFNTRFDCDSDEKRISRLIHSRFGWTLKLPICPRGGGASLLRCRQVQPNLSQSGHLRCFVRMLHGQGAVNSREWQAICLKQCLRMGVVQTEGNRREPQGTAGNRRKPQGTAVRFSLHTRQPLTTIPNHQSTPPFSIEAEVGRGLDLLSHSRIKNG